MIYEYRFPTVKTLIQEMVAAAERYDDMMECSCSDEDNDGGVCWYDLSSQEQRKWALDFIVDSVTA